ncbi:MAG: hypothetical protein HC884_18640 [Chloroflexaceae bacterium]|nr:hypothetical protein [Chloroflexaceae bacterium]
MENNHQQLTFMTYGINVIGLATLIFIALMAGAFLTPSPYHRLKPEPAPVLSTGAQEPEAPAETSAEDTTTSDTSWFQEQAEAEGWTVITSRDINGDGTPEVVAYRPSDVSRPEALSEPSYLDFDLLVSEFLIAQEGEEAGETRDLLRVTTEQVTVNGKAVMTLTFPNAEASRIPVAFLSRYQEDDATPLTVVPINQSGEPFMKSIGFSWDTERQQYRMVMAEETP